MALEYEEYEVLPAEESGERYVLWLNRLPQDLISEFLNPSNSLSIKFNKDAYVKLQKYII